MFFTRSPSGLSDELLYQPAQTFFLEYIPVVSKLLGYHRVDQFYSEQLDRGAVAGEQQSAALVLLERVDNVAHAVLIARVACVRRKRDLRLLFEREKLAVGHPTDICRADVVENRRDCVAEMRIDAPL